MHTRMRPSAQMHNTVSAGQSQVVRLRGVAKKQQLFMARMSFASECTKIAEVSPELKLTEGIFLANQAKVR